MSVRVFLEVLMLVVVVLLLGLSKTSISHVMNFGLST